MNTPPKTFIRVRHEDLHRFVSAAAQTVGLPEAKAELLARLLTDNDLRGVFSHGTQQIAAYARLMRDGTLNNRPEPRIVRETPTSLQFDGDGGLGYFPCYEGMLALIEKAKAAGIAVLSTKNHGHFGAAGIYSRLTLKHDLLTFVTSGHQLGNFRPGSPLVSAGGGSPMSFSTPTGEEYASVLDFGTMHDLYLGNPHREEISRLAPAMVFRALGLAAICQSWGGFLAGVPFDPARAVRKWEGANQGSLIVTFRIDLFAEPEPFKREMDEYIRAVKTLQPLEGFDQSFLPGGIETQREEAFRREGVPVGEHHRKRLEELAAELGIAVTW